MGRGGIEIEPCRIGIIFRAESHVLLATSDIKRVLERKFIVRSVDSHDTVAASVYYAEFAALEKVFCLQRVDGLKCDGFSDRHNTAVDYAVVKGVGEVDFVYLHHGRHHEVRPKLFGVVVLDIVGMTGAEYRVLSLCRGCEGCSHNCQGCEYFFHWIIQWIVCLWSLFQSSPFGFGLCGRGSTTSSPWLGVPECRNRSI